MRTANRSIGLLFLLSGLVVFADQLTKWLIVAHFALYQSKTVMPGLFNLVYVRNTGAAFSLLADANPAWRSSFFIAISCAALVFIGITFRQYSGRSVLYLYAFSLIAGGAAGNLIDRLRFGSVVDFLDFYVGRYHWPAFNVADSSIVVGVGLFVLAGLLERGHDAS